MSTPSKDAPTQQAAPPRSRFFGWLEIFATAMVVIVALAAAHGMFWPKDVGNNMEMSQFTMFQKRVDLLSDESDPIKRDSACIPLSSFGRSINAQLPPDARVYLLEMLGQENLSKMGYYYFLTYYLFPRELAISMDKPAVFALTTEATGRDPVSAEEMTQAGYNLSLKQAPDGRWQTQLLKPMSQIPPETPKPISPSDTPIAFLLPLAVALTGTRLVRWLFKDLDGILTMGELLACGLAICLCFTTQIILGLRLAGLRMEQPLAVAIFIWAAVEVVLFARRFRPGPFKLKPAYLWWLLLIPAAWMLWVQFRLAGVEGLLGFDAIASWAFRAKIFHLLAGSDLWPWFKNPALSYAHFDYPTVVPLMHALTYGLLGHINEFITKFWPQWMLLFLAWSVLSATKFPNKRPWLVAAGVSVLLLNPTTIQYARDEAATLPTVFYTVLGSIQLALGMIEKQPGRIRLGMFVLLMGGLVKLEGMVIVAFWAAVLLFDRDSRAAFWPPRRVVVLGLVGFSTFLPFAIYRMMGPVETPVASWVSLLISNFNRVLHTEPMTWVAFLSRRFLHSDFASWNSPDNEHAVWQGKWMGFQSFVDQHTLGLGWACLLLLLALLWCGKKERLPALRFFLVFLAFASFISLVWCAVFLTYNNALLGSAQNEGGRYIYPVYLAWFVASLILLARAMPAQVMVKYSDNILSRPSKATGSKREKQESISEPSDLATEIIGAFQTLGLKPAARWHDVRAAYRTKMQEYHPDKVATLGEKLRHLAEEEAKKINSAYDLLATHFKKNK